MDAKKAIPEDYESGLSLGIDGFSYPDLYEPGRLAELARTFDAAVLQQDPDLYHEFETYRASQGQGFAAAQVSDLLVRMAPHLSRFLGKLFDVQWTQHAQADSIQREVDAVFGYRRAIVERVAKRFTPNELAAWDLTDLQRSMDCLQRISEPQGDNVDPEYRLAQLAMRLVDLAARFQDLEKQGASEDADRTAEISALRRKLASDAEAARQFAEALGEESAEAFVQRLLDFVQRWTYAAAAGSAIGDTVRGWSSFKKIGRVDFTNLVDFETRDLGQHSGIAISESKRRLRDGFALTDHRFDQREVLFEVDHCIYCHDRDRDSCSKGMRKKDGSFRDNPLGVTLTGCPLEEKISEAHLLKRRGDNIAALAVIVIDNPQVPGTGHRICNDCMKGCIYQKVEPVNIPQIETNILTDVLFMPYGFEIYSLLTRWNPLNVKRHRALPYNGKNALIVGLGPAGYTMAHYLLNEGFGVVGIDALKIEPLPRELIGDPGTPPSPIQDFRQIYEELDQRVLAGFGGVAEYGITSRWDKNFLKVIYLTLARRSTFSCYGGIRFGGTLTIDDAWDLGFDHIAIASGAGKPTLIGLKNNLIRGIRKASDFLMGLQLTGAAKRSSLANLQVRLPAAVIGGGLTAVDTATELLAYYPVQVERALERYERLVTHHGEAAMLGHYDDEERGILHEFLVHGRAVRAERQQARAEGRSPDFLPLLREWGGVTLFYRKGLSDAPAYRQNHEEIQKALEEGIVFSPGMNPVEAVPDQHGHLSEVVFEHQELVDGRWSGTGTQSRIPLRSLFVAAGTSPNIIYENEHPGSFELDAKFFQRFDARWEGKQPELEPVQDTPLPKVGNPAPFTSYREGGRYITFLGDNHPVYAGNVVKAMASARDAYPSVVKLFDEHLASLKAEDQQRRDAALVEFKSRLDDQLLATVVEVNRLTPTIVEVVARAPMQARKFHPGQFYRLQNLETHAPLVAGTRLSAEGLALTGAWVDKGKGLISLITLEMGSSSKLCRLWQPGEPLVVMGPTGAATEIPRNKNVLLIGGGLGNAVLFSIGKAMREAGSRVVYFAGYKAPHDVFKVDDLEQASDVLVWAVDPGPGVQALPTRRPQDKSFVGNIVEAMVAYGEGALGEAPVPLQDVDHLIVIGSDRMMDAVKAARFGVLQPYLRDPHIAIGSINSPMQCMMKGVCAQCMCKHVDPSTGQESFVYSCFNQDQTLDAVDFPNLNARLRQNSVHEKLSNLWLDYVLEQHPLPRV